MEEKELYHPPKMQFMLLLLLSISLTLNLLSGIYQGQANLEAPGTSSILSASAISGLNNFRKNPEAEFLSRLAALKPVATVAAVKMNLLYAGIDNPISVAIPGVRAEQLLVTSSGASVSGSMGEYNVRVPLGISEITINATAKGTNIGGGVKFRVRPLPRPVVAFGTISTPTASIASIRAVNFIYASLGEGFAFDGVSYTVTKYSFMHVPRRGIPTMLTVSGPSVTPQIKQIYQGIATGDQIIIYDVRAKGPAGEVLLTTSVLLTVR